VGDAHDTTTNMVATIAAELSWTFDFTATNEAALAKAAVVPFDLIVTGERTSSTEDIELLRQLRSVRPHTRLIILTDESTPAEVIAAMRASAFSYFSKPFSPATLAEMIRMAAEAVCWDDGIEVVSATPAWIRLLIRGDKSTADRLVQFVSEISFLPETEKSEVAFAFREILLNAVQHGTRFDPSKYIEVSYVRARHMISCRIKDPGEGFSLAELYHSAVSNPCDDPIRHARYREVMGLRPGGYGILVARHMVDEVIYGEYGNDVLLIKYLNRESLNPEA
jgi:DNA-binding NarL/FixJ family response regulator